ncbi:MAG: major facilitator superfamily domain-containing protein 1, partial [Planctomycetes bacterium]|nr:major facilitator superfamily domain-containing protein 1 [Planctomycetota bacterium]
WSGTLWIGVAAGAICVVSAAVYWRLEDNATRKYELGKAGSIDRLKFDKGMFQFSRSYWLIVGLCFTFYSAIFPFRTFANKFFQHVHFSVLEPDVANQSAGFFNSLLPLSAMIATPLFGLLVDRVGKRSLFMVLGTFLLMPVYLLMLSPEISLWVPMVMMGIAFSLIPAVMWPSVAYIVEEHRLGTAYALMTLIQQIGFFAFNWLIGWANTQGAASANNPGGYALGMYIFSALSILGLVFAFLLRRSETGPGGHGLETITAGSSK